MFSGDTYCPNDPPTSTRVVSYYPSAYPSAGYLSLYASAPSAAIYELLPSSSHGICVAEAPSAAIPEADASDSRAAGLNLTQLKQYEGTKYGSGKNQFNCVTFTWQALEDCGVLEGLSEDACQAVKKATMLSDVAQDDIARYVKDGSQKIQGAPGALVAHGCALPVRSDSLQAGDVVQYWYRDKNSGAWCGHAGVVSQVNSDGTFYLYGAHASKGRVTTMGPLNIKHCQPLYAARPFIPLG